ncbi:MAG: leucine--tRNA ligase [Actinomycetota bacterium]
MELERYDPSEIEHRWLEEWDRAPLYQAVDDPADERPRFYALDMFPYPSGDLHMGHLEAFTGGDVIARFRMLRGYNVLHPIGWDAFGLPAENAAIKRGVNPKEWTYANIEQQASSFRRLGMSFDWSRRFNTCDPEYYRWTQWIFLKLYEQGLAYRKAAVVNWCPQDQTVLANEQVITGRCERCDTVVIRRDLVQWFFKITDYAQRLLDDVDELRNWPERVLTMQRNWIGRSRGADVVFRIAETGEDITVFTTRPDTLWGVTYFVLAAEHPKARELASLSNRLNEYEAFVSEVRASTEIERQALGKRKRGFNLGAHAINPVNGEHVPIFAADYVLMEYGTGAIMAVPGHDQRDFEFAQQEGLPVRLVIKPSSGEPVEAPFEGEGVMVGSGPFDGTASPESIDRVIDWLEEQKLGAGVVRFRIRDWLISRQRAWGAPIPVIHCETDGIVPVPEEDLPVRLPDDMEFMPSGSSPLARHEGFVNVACPACGKPAKRETDTMDTFVDSSWYFFRYCSPFEESKAFDSEAVARWMPVDQYTGGVEHAILHLLYSRFFTKVLYDMGYVGFTEPWPNLLNQGQVIMEGAAMSKSRGNLVAPKEIVDRFGADTARVTMLFAGPFEDDVDWADVSPQGIFRWLSRVFRLVVENAARIQKAGTASGASELRRRAHRAIAGVTSDTERFKFNTAISKMMVLSNDLQSIGSTSSDEDVREALTALVQMLAPYAPFLSEELWSRIGGTGSVHTSIWPSFDEKLAAEQKVTMVVQVNGKVRDRFEVDPSIAQDEMESLARASSKVAEQLDGAQVLKTIIVAPKLVNFVVKG